jgi:hypothetical protein
MAASQGIQKEHGRGLTRCLSNGGGGGDRRRDNDDVRSWPFACRSRSTASANAAVDRRDDTVLIPAASASTRWWQGKVFLRLRDARRWQLTDLLRCGLVDQGIDGDDPIDQGGEAVGGGGGGRLPDTGKWSETECSRKDGIGGWDREGGVATWKAERRTCARVAGCGGRAEGRTHGGVGLSIVLCTL